MLASLTRSVKGLSQPCRYLEEEIYGRVSSQCKDMAAGAWLARPRNSREASVKRVEQPRERKWEMRFGGPQGSWPHRPFEPVVRTLTAGMEENWVPCRDLTQAGKGHSSRVRTQARGQRRGHCSDPTERWRLRPECHQRGLSGSGYVLKLEPARLSEGFDMGCETKKSKP